MRVVYILFSIAPVLGGCVTTDYDGPKTRLDTQAAMTYPKVHEMPAKSRQPPSMGPGDQARLKAELIEVRARQISSAAKKNGSKQAGPVGHGAAN